MPKEGPLGERTETATAKKREQAREEGQVAMSKDLAQALVLLVTFLLLNFYGVVMFEEVTAFSVALFERLHEVAVHPDGTLRSLTPTDVHAWGAAMLWSLLGLMAPIWAVIFVTGVSLAVLQVGIHFTTKPLTKFDLNRFNPITGLQRLLFSIRSVMKLMFSLLKLFAIGVLLYYTLKEEVYAIPPLMETASVAAVGLYMWEVSFWMSVKVAALLVLMGIFDLAYQRWQHEEDLKMSKKEVEDEMKTMEGDPKIKGKRREIQRRLALNRMMKKVPEADVVITNPTELAIALTYADEDPAPRVVAKGAGYVAERIRTLAVEAGVPVIEKKPLVQALFRAVEVGEFVPERFWQAVAEVLAYVYELENLKRARAAR